MSKQAKTALPAPRPGEKLSRLRQRQKLIDACISALHQHGPSRTTIDKVVAIADMSPGIVNFYFETKAALLVAALEYLAVEFEERVLAPLGALRETPVLALQRLIELYLDPDIASPRKVSVWYAFWGEASSRHEYFDICGKRDLAFAELVRDLMAGLIERSGAAHLDADAVALGLIGSLEMIWQGIAFQDEMDIDRAAGRQRCLAYLGSVFPEQFPLAGRAAPRPAASVRRPSGSVAPVRQLHDACAMLVAAELSLAGLGALRVPEYWPEYDVLAQPPAGVPQRIVVLAASFASLETFIDMPAGEGFDWLGIVILPGESVAARRLFLIPRAALHHARCTVAEVGKLFAAFENNFALEVGA
jgi:TetR/AcrR family transcriptional repressor of bet genes